MRCIDIKWVGYRCWLCRFLSFFCISFCIFSTFLLIFRFHSWGKCFVIWGFQFAGSCIRPFPCWDAGCGSSHLCFCEQLIVKCSCHWFFSRVWIWTFGFILFIFVVRWRGFRLFLSRLIFLFTLLLKHCLVLRFRYYSLRVCCCWLCYLWRDCCFWFYHRLLWV